jgi:GT2 family glycosyltransferase
MKISIVIANWNGEDLLKKCLPAVIDAAEHTKKTYEIIVVDDASTDGSVRLLKSKFPKIKLIELKDNRGYIKVSNVGAKAAKGDMLMFVNTDIVLKTDSLKWMLKHFKNPKVFGVAPKILRWDKKTIQAEFIGCDFVLGTVVQTQPGMNEPDTNRFKEPRMTFYAPGGASMIVRKKFLELGGLDEIYSPFYGEEYDLSYRAYKRGWVVIYEPKAVVYHKHRASLTKVFTQEELLMQELKTRFIFTWSNFSNHVILAKHFVFLPLVFLRSAFKGYYRCERFLDVKAFFQALGHLRQILKKRSENKKYAKLSDSEVLNLINSNKANELSPVSFWKFLGLR